MAYWSIINSEKVMHMTDQDSVSHSGKKKARSFPSNFPIYSVNLYLSNSRVVQKLAKTTGYSIRKSTWAKGETHLRHIAFHD